MSDESTPPRDLDWYRSRWDELTELLSVSDPEAVVDEVRRLQERVKTLNRQHEALAEADLDAPEQAVEMINNVVAQLEELYAERDRRGEPHFERTEVGPDPENSE